MRKLSIDIETYSDVDLIKCGVYRYVDSPKFEILLFAYCFDDGDIQIIDLAQGEGLSAEIKMALSSPEYIKTAYNAQFERICLSKQLGIRLDPNQWCCTAVQAAELSLPASLADVGAALGLERQKLTEGKELIRYFCVPCKPTKTNGGRTRNMPQDASDKWELFKQYCIRDVDVERQIAYKLRKYPISESEHALYVLDQRINDRGVLVDTELAQQAVKINNIQTAVATDQAYELTGLENPNSVSQLKEWLSDNGVEIESLSKKAVAYDSYTKRFDKAKSEYDKLQKTREERLYKAEVLSGFMFEIQEIEELPLEFDEKLWNSVIDKVVVNEDETVIFKFRNGAEITELL
ncbi:MAG: hypothetical protein IJH37_08405 [Clostridia bacterium]|nr:hypothetical protein [Clostridia bacterium]